MRECYSASISPIDENNDSVSKSWIVYRHGIVAKFTSVVEFSVTEDLAIWESAAELGPLVTVNFQTLHNLHATVYRTQNF